MTFSGSEIVNRARKRSPMRRVLRSFMLFVLLPVILTINGCGFLITGKRDSVSYGMLKAEVDLLNPGAMSDYSGAVWVMPRYFPHIWPFYIIVGCRALIFESDPRINLSWEGEALVIEHDRLIEPSMKQDRCYGHDIVFVERHA